MDWTNLVISIVTSLIGVSIGGTLLSYYLAKKEINKQKEIIKTKSATQIIHNFKNIAQLSSNMQSIEQLIEPLSKSLTVEEAGRVLAKINELKGILIGFAQQVETEADIHRCLLELYETFAPHSVSQRIGIFRNVIISTKIGCCGQWGVATPEEYREELEKYGARYIDPFQGHDVLKSCKIIINPYGEYYFVRDERALERFAEMIKMFFETGCIWIHVGGYPFYTAFIKKQRKFVPTGSTVAEEIGLEIQSAYHGGEIIPSMPEGVRYLVHGSWRCVGGVRSLRNVDLVYATARSEKDNMNVLATKRIGRGLFIHYGGMHPVKQKEVISSLCRLIKRIALETWTPL